MADSDEDLPLAGDGPSDSDEEMPTYHRDPDAPGTFSKRLSSLEAVLTRLGTMRPDTRDRLRMILSMLPVGGVHESSRARVREVVDDFLDDMTEMFDDPRDQDAVVVLGGVKSPRPETYARTRQVLVRLLKGATGKPQRPSGPKPMDTGEGPSRR